MAGDRDWSDEERDLLALVTSGLTVVVNVRTGRDAPHPRLAPHLKDAGLLVYIGRRNRGGWPQSRWANPFRIGSDDERARMVEQYDAWLHAPEQADLLAVVPTLKGKALGCWCAPKPCHGDVLRALADAS